MAFTTRLLVRFNLADKDGIMFFGNLNFLAHMVLERFIEAAGFTWKEWFENPGWRIPYRHTVTDYFKPHFPGRELDARLTVTKLGDTSFTWRVQFHSVDGEPMSEASFVNVFVHPETMAKVPMPDDVRSRLEPYLEEVS